MTALEAVERAARSRLARHAARAGTAADHAREVPLEPDVVEVTTGVPDWWLANGNAFFAAPGASVDEFLTHPGQPPPTGAVVVLGRLSNLASVMLWGDGALVIVGGNVWAPRRTLSCGGKSTIVVGHGMRFTGQPRIDSRNGGLVYVGGGGGCAPGVRLYTDDMHAIRDVKSGARVNAYGGTIFVGRHVWLGEDAILVAGASVGDDSVVGARSLVTGAIPANVVCAGSPARVLRTGTTWTFEDLP